MNGYKGAAAPLSLPRGTRPPKARHKEQSFTGLEPYFARMPQTDVISYRCAACTAMALQKACEFLSRILPEALLAAEARLCRWPVLEIELLLSFAGLSLKDSLCRSIQLPFGFGVWPLHRDMFFLFGLWHMSHGQDSFKGTK